MYQLFTIALPLDKLAFLFSRIFDGWRLQTRFGSNIDSFDGRLLLTSFFDTPFISNKTGDVVLGDVKLNCERLGLEFAEARVPLSFLKSFTILLALHVENF